MLIRRLHKRGATITVEAHAEVLFTPEGDIGVWQRRVSAFVRNAVAAEAPANKRPRWKHYGPPLKSSFTASTSYQPERMRVYSAVGSRADYAAFVDQGTGIYSGRGPYPAKVLPPWFRGSPSLYERTWRAGPNGPETRAVMIRGQKGQRFFEKGLKRGLTAAGLPTVAIPLSGPAVGVLKSAPADMVDEVLSGAGGAGTFQDSLTEWRRWRDAAFKAGRPLGGGSTNEHQRRAFAKETRARARRRRADVRAAFRAADSAERSRQWRERNKPRDEDRLAAAEKVADRRSRSAQKAAFVKAAMKKYGKVDAGSIELRGGYWYMTVWGKDSQGRSTWIETRRKAD